MSVDNRSLKDELKTLVGGPNWAAFTAFIQTGDASPEFLSLLESDPALRRAVDLAFEVQAVQFNNFAESNATAALPLSFPSEETKELPSFGRGTRSRSTNLAWIVGAAAILVLGTVGAFLLHNRDRDYTQLRNQFALREREYQNGLSAEVERVLSDPKSKYSIAIDNAKHHAELARAQAEDAQHQTELVRAQLEDATKAADGRVAEAKAAAEKQYEAAIKAADQRIKDAQKEADDRIAVVEQSARGATVAWDAKAFVNLQQCAQLSYAASGSRNWARTLNYRYEGHPRTLPIIALSQWWGSPPTEATEKGIWDGLPELVALQKKPDQVAPQLIDAIVKIEHQLPVQKDASVEPSEIPLDDLLVKRAFIQYLCATQPKTFEPLLVKALKQAPDTDTGPGTEQSRAAAAFALSAIGPRLGQEARETLREVRQEAVSRKLTYLRGAVDYALLKAGPPATSTKVDPGH